MVFISVLYFILVIIVASFFTPEGYSLLTNTISEMASQQLPNAWIMRVGFIGFGVIMSAGLGFDIKTKRISPWVAIPFIGYALSIFATGIWSTNYSLSVAPYSEFETNMHSLFATLAGFLLIAAILIEAVITKKMQVRWFNIAFVLGISLFSGLYALFPEIQGIFQRVMYLVSFWWMILFYFRSKKLIIKV